MDSKNVSDLAHGVVELNQKLTEFNNAPGDFNKDDQPAFDRILEFSRELAAKAKPLQDEQRNDPNRTENIDTPNDPDANAQRERAQKAASPQPKR